MTTAPDHGRKQAKPARRLAITLAVSAPIAIWMLWLLG